MIILNFITSPETTTSSFEAPFVEWHRTWMTAWSC